MCNHETHKCPRCGNGFACKPGNITQCQCFGISITEEQRAYMDKKYNDCLCKDCLIHLQSEVNRFVETHIKR
ncbi:MAG: cysteine-rich CWC family protein [Chitinophagaceae bacterium]|nr:cysteine-rich CWC family protein [Chitinophagaceae bacterium]